MNAFSDLLRPYRFDCYLIPGHEPVNLEWQESVSYQNFIESSLDTMQSFLTPMQELDIVVNLCIYTRSQRSPDIPRQSWVSLSGNTIFIGRDPTCLWFDTTCTAFRRESAGLDDNTELYLLNQPLLEKALRAWEEECGVITNAEGFPGVYKYGFL